MRLLSGFIAANVTASQRPCHAEAQLMQTVVSMKNMIMLNKK